MITQWHASASQTAYQDLRFDFLKRVEDTRTLPYLDSKQIPTIGVGFNLRDLNVQQRVFEAMQIDISLISVTNGAARAAEQSYIDLLVAAIDLSYATGQNNILRPNLDAVMFNRAHDPLLQGFAHIAGRGTGKRGREYFLTPKFPDTGERGLDYSIVRNAPSGSTAKDWRWARCRWRSVSIMGVEQLPTRIQTTFGGWPKRKLR